VRRKKKCKVFVSYSRHDESLVKPLAGLLGVAANDAVFLDVTSIKPGQKWKSEIERAIRESTVFVLCWCCESEKSKFIAHEIKMAMHSGGKRLAPVLFCGTPLPRSLADRQWIDLRGRVVHDCTNAKFHVEKDPHGSIDDRTEIIDIGRVVHNQFEGIPVVFGRPRNNADDIASRARSYFEHLGESHQHKP
jgi:hypothetical protein